jgi:hypothetical protein
LIAPDGLIAKRRAAARIELPPSTARDAQAQVQANGTGIDSSGVDDSSAKVQQA